MSTRQKAFLKRIGKNITRYRKKRKLTVRELATLVKMNHSNLCRITTGRTNTSVIVVLSIASKLKVNPSVLLK